MNTVESTCGREGGSELPAYSALTDSLAGYKGPTSKGREGRKDGREGQGRGKREERGPTFKARGGKGGRKRDGRVSPPNLETKLRPSRGGNQGAHLIHDYTQSLDTASRSVRPFLPAVRC